MCRGEVYSVFDRAANILLAPDSLLALIAPWVAQVPNGIVLPAPGTGSPFLGLEPGLTVGLGNGCVHIPAVGIEIETAMASVWDPRPSFETRLVGRVPRHGLAQLDSLLRAHAGSIRDGFATLLTGACDSSHLGFARRAAPAIVALLTAITESDPDDSACAAGALAGLGPGLTPSGDDFLIGVCAALFLARSLHGEETGGEHHARAIAAGTPGRTTLLSAVWLRHAAAGEFSAELGELMLSVASGSPTDVTQATAAVLALGASSGFDTAFGFLRGAQAILCHDVGACGRSKLRPRCERQSPIIQRGPGAR